VRHDFQQCPNCGKESVPPAQPGGLPSIWGGKRKDETEEEAEVEKDQDPQDSVLDALEKGNDPSYEKKSYGELPERGPERRVESERRVPWTDEDEANHQRELEERKNMGYSTTEIQRVLRAEQDRRQQQDRRLNDMSPIQCPECRAGTLQGPACNNCGITTEEILSKPTSREADVSTPPGTTVPPAEGGPSTPPNAVEGEGLVPQHPVAEPFVGYQGAETGNPAIDEQLQYAVQQGATPEEVRQKAAEQGQQALQQQHQQGWTPQNMYQLASAENPLADILTQYTHGFVSQARVDQVRKLLS
jgi:ribosomal protein L32